MALPPRHDKPLWCQMCILSGHIACDVASRSELVVPWISGESLIGVLDVDSPIPTLLL